jgi:fructose-bisphosphate aldolase class II
MCYNKLNLKGETMIKQIMQDALQNGYALGAFNFATLDILKAIIGASEQSGKPVIAAVSEGALKFLEKDYLKALIKTTKERPNNKVNFHLDHGKNFDICALAIDIGFDSVMIDASHLPFEQNVELTKQVCDYAHAHGVWTEGELGVLAGQEEDVVAEKSIYTDPLQAKEFVQKTGVDMLAIAIGTSHGAYKFSGEAKLNLERLAQIESQIPITPLVLHGASSVDEQHTQKFNQFGGNLTGAKGVPGHILQFVCKNHHVCKINTDTDLRICFLAALRESFSSNPQEIDIRKHLTHATEQTKQLILQKISLFGQ